MYPNGNNKDGGSGYLSLYVAIDKSSLDASAHQEVYADLRFYIFNRNGSRGSTSPSKVFFAKLFFFGKNPPKNCK